MHILIWKQKGTVDNLDLQTEDCGQDEKFMKEAIKQAKKAVNRMDRPAKIPMSVVLMVRMFPNR